MAEYLEQTSSLELANDKGELFELDNFTPVGSREIISEPLTKDDVLISKDTFESNFEGQKIQVTVTCEHGQDGSSVQDTEVLNIPEGLQITSPLDFDFVNENY